VPAGAPRQVNRPQAETAKGSVRVDEVEDEDAPTGEGKKKKKKKKPKKKPAAPGEGGLTTVAEAEAEDAEGDEGVSETPELPVPAEETPATPTSPPTAGAASKNKKKKKKPASKSAGLGASIYNESQSSIWSGLSTTETAQSAHSYLKEAGPDSKEKVKTRAGHANMVAESGDKKSAAASLIPGFSAPRTFFSKMKKKTRSFMKTLMGAHDDEDKKGMRWDHFVAVSTLLYSVRLG
jgi:hypothetical protein